MVALAFSIENLHILQAESLLGENYTLMEVHLDVTHSVCKKIVIDELCLPVYVALVL
jgi:hypothetical protein